jgi:phosphoserine phosphatase
VIGQPLTPGALGAVTGAIATGGGNIDRIIRLASQPVTAFEFTVLDGDLDRMRTALVAASGSTGSTCPCSARTSSGEPSGWSCWTWTPR